MIALPALLFVFAPVDPNIDQHSTREDHHV